MTVSLIDPVRFSHEDARELREEFGPEMLALYPLGFLVYCGSRERLEQVRQIVSGDMMYRINNAWASKHQADLDEFDRLINLRLTAHRLSSTQDSLPPLTERGSCLKTQYEPDEEAVLLAAVSAILEEDEE